jgi:hypothetical protein
VLLTNGDLIKKHREADKFSQALKRSIETKIESGLVLAMQRLVHANELQFVTIDRIMEKSKFPNNYCPLQDKGGNHPLWSLSMQQRLQLPFVKWFFIGVDCMCDVWKGKDPDYLTFVLGLDIT